MSTLHSLVPGGAVVAGVDGSAPALAAVDLAVREANLRNRPLWIVHAFIWPYLGVSVDPSPVAPPESGLRHDAERVVAEAVDRARVAAPRLAVHGEVIVGGPAAVLRQCSETAALVVVGDRGLGGFTGLLAGSVAVQLTAHAASPVLVARGEPGRGGGVLVGVDGSPANDAAIGFAFEEASLRGVPLTALHAFTHPVSTGPGDMLPLVHDRTELTAEEERVLAEALAGWREKFPDVSTRRVLVHGGARRALIEATTAARLVVVGSRGRGGFTGLVLGSVSQAVLHHAHCPVAVVPFWLG